MAVNCAAPRKNGANWGVLPIKAAKSLSIRLPPLSRSRGKFMWHERCGKEISGNQGPDTDLSSRKALGA